MVAHTDACRAVNDPNLSVALKSDDPTTWVKHIQEEFNSLVENLTWEDRNYPPPNVCILPSGVILKVERDVKGNLVPYMARLVARGKLHSDLVDYTEL